MDQGFIEEMYDEAAEALRRDRERVATLYRLYRAGKISEDDYQGLGSAIVAGTLEMVQGPLRLVAQRVTVRDVGGEG